MTRVKQEKAKKEAVDAQDEEHNWATLALLVGQWVIRKPPDVPPCTAKRVVDSNPARRRIGGQWSLNFTRR